MLCRPALGFIHLQKRFAYVLQIRELCIFTSQLFAWGEVTKRRFQRHFLCKMLEESESRQTYWNVVLKIVFTCILIIIEATRGFPFPQCWKRSSPLIYFMGLYLAIFFQNCFNLLHFYGKLQWITRYTKSCTDYQASSTNACFLTLVLRHIKIEKTLVVHLTRQLKIEQLITWTKRTVGLSTTIHKMWLQMFWASL